MTMKFFEDPHFHLVFNRLKDGIFIADRNGVALWVNDASTKQIGVPRSEIIGKSVDYLERKGLFNPSVTRIVLDKGETITKVQTSKDRQYLATGYIVEVQKGVTEYVLVQIKDITETFRASLQLEKAENLIQKYWSELQELKARQKAEQHGPLIIGKSKRHEEMLDLISRVATVDATVLLSGETGVGKSHIAQEVHRRSNRTDKPFVQINCGAIPETLLESELFGYKKGAFTGASNSGKIGLAEKADGGTLFLDEIGELPLSLQPKLLQLVQDKSFIPLGGTGLKKADIRIITATNQDLSQMVKEKKFREDLYYRLNVISVNIPALRERRDDILPLAFHFFELFKQKYQKESVLSKELLDFLQDYKWPGNIRELENMMERLIVTAKSTVIETEALSDKMLNETRHEDTSYIKMDVQNLQDYLDRIEKEVIEQARSKYGSTRKAAQSLGITQSSYIRRLKKHNL